MDLTLWVELVVFVILMGLSGLFSSSETSLFSLSKLQLEQMRRDENPRVGLIDKLLSEPRRLIVTILIGNEFVNVTASVISAAVIIQLYGAESKYINLFVMIPILLLVGEITPKTLAIKNNVVFATHQSVFIDKFAWLITPLRTVVRFVADKLITLVVGKERSRGNIVTQDMVRTLAREAVGDGVLHVDEARYIDQIFDFGTKTVEEVMTPRSNVFFLSNDLPMSEILKEIRRTRYTKIPVYGEHRDEVLGILYARDLVGSDLINIPDDPDWLSSRLREPFLVPESKPVVELFRTFRKRRLSMALIVDEYGGVTGLVTIEDLLECIFGELPSESEILMADDLRNRIQNADHIHASMTVAQFNLGLDAALPTDVAETIGGLILHEYGEMPPIDAKVVCKGWELTVVAVESNRIQEIKAKQVGKAAKKSAGPPQHSVAEPAPKAAEARGKDAVSEASPRPAKDAGVVAESGGISKKAGEE